MPVKDLTAKILSGGTFARARYDSQAYIQEPSLVSHYKFNGNSTDSVDGNNLTAYNSPTYVVGQVDNAIQLVSASSQYVKISHASQVGLEMGGDFTISCWIKATTIGSAMVVCSKNSPSRTEQYSLEIDSAGHLVINIYTGAAYSVTSNLVIAAGSWYHVVAFFDSVNNLLKLYINGVFDKQTSTTGSLTSSSNDFAIGTYGSSPANYFDGQIDEFQIWNTVLAVGDIYTLYLNGIGSGAAGGGYGFGTYVSISTTLAISGKTDEDLSDIPQYASLTAYHRFAGNPIDRSLNGYDLVPTNTPTYATALPYASGEAVSLNGSSQYFTCLKGMSVRGLDEFSISVWVYVDALKNYNNIIAESINGAATVRMQAYIDANGAVSLIGQTDAGGANIFAKTANGQIQAAKWYNLVFVYDNTTDAHKIYLNGVDVTSATVAGVTFTDSDPTNGPYVGAQDASNYFFDGYISEYMYWKAIVLSAAEVLQLFSRGYLANAHRNGYQAVAAPALTNIYSTDVTKMPSYASIKGYWKMDEASWDGTPDEIIDYSGNGYHGVRGGDATTLADGKVSRAGTFDGTGDYANVGKLGSWGSQIGATGGLTVSFWLRTTDAGFKCPFGVTQGAGYGTQQFYVYLNYDEAWNPEANAVSFMIERPDGGAYKSTQVSFNKPAAFDGNWHHHCVVFDVVNTTSQRYYFDGVLQTLTYGPNNVDASSWANWSQDIYIGGANAAGSLSNALDGDVDELAIWNAKLTPVEAAALYLGKSAALTVKSGNFLPQPAEVRLNAKLGESDFSGGATDSSLMVNSLTDNNTVAALQNGRSEADCADFTSANSEYLHRTNANQKGLILVGQKMMSFFTWMRVKSATSAEIAGCMADSTGWCLQYDATNKRLKVRMNGTTGVAYSATSSIVVGKWHYVGFVWNGSTVQCYIDGTASGLAASYTTVLAANSYDFSLGRSAGSSGGTPFDGQLQQATVWAINLTAGQVATLYGYAFAAQPTAMGSYIELEDWSPGGGKVPWGIVRSPVQDLGPNGAVSLNRLNFTQVPTSGVDIVMRTRTGPTPTPDETWEAFRPVNDQRILDSLESGTFLGEGWKTSDENVLQIGSEVLSGVTGLSLTNSGLTTGQYIEKHLPVPVDITGMEFISFDAHTTRSGIELQLQLGTGNLAGDQVLPGTFDIYMASGNSPFGEMMTRQYADLRNVVSGANLDPSSIDYLAFKILDGSADQTIHLSDLAAGIYLHSGSNTIQSTPQRYIQIESILGTVQ